jgi:hypothetical protein
LVDDALVDDALVDACKIDACKIDALVGILVGIRNIEDIFPPCFTLVHRAK